jgi:hypothetical protein
MFHAWTDHDLHQTSEMWARFEMVCLANWHFEGPAQTPGKKDLQDYLHMQAVLDVPRTNSDACVKKLQVM